MPTQEPQRCMGAARCPRARSVFEVGGAQWRSQCFLEGSPVRKVRELYGSLRAAAGRRCFNSGAQDGDVQRLADCGAPTGSPATERLPQSANARARTRWWNSARMVPLVPGGASVHRRGPWGQCGVRRLTGCRWASPGQRVPTPFRSRLSREGDTGQGYGGHLGSQAAETRGWARGSSPTTPVSWRPQAPFP